MGEGGGGASGEGEGGGGDGDGDDGDGGGEGGGGGLGDGGGGRSAHPPSDAGRPVPTLQTRPFSVDAVAPESWMDPGEPPPGKAMFGWSAFRMQSPQSMSRR